jgi:hypothetical protein
LSENAAADAAPLPAVGERGTLEQQHSGVGQRRRRAPRS